MKLNSNNYSNLFRLRIVKLFIENKYTVLELVKIFCVSKSSIYNWIKLFKNNNLKEKTKYFKSSSILRNQQLQSFIQEYITNNPNFNYILLLEILRKTFLIQIKKSSLYNIIKKINFSKKVVKTKKIYGCKYKLNDKKRFLQQIIKNINYNDIISIDEVSFDTNIIHNYAWSKKNIPVFKNIGATYKRLTMICAISNKKIIHYKIVNNSADKNIFLEFLKNIPNITNKYLFLDNAKIHHAKIVKEYIETNNINLLFNVAYSPEFNPIENMFSKLKKLVKDCSDNNNLDILKINIQNSLKHITASDLTNFYIHSFNNLLNNVF